jgi:CheY-like chemotaxis protein
MSGYELARAIRQRRGTDSVRLVALTGYGQAADRQATREAGFDAHLTKPLKPSDRQGASGIRARRAGRTGSGFPGIGNAPSGRWSALVLLWGGIGADAVPPHLHSGCVHRRAR